MISIKQNNLKDFILIVLIPIMGIIMMFTFAFIYVQNEIDFISHEKRGLQKIYNIQDIVFDLQKLRGLSQIINKDEKCLLDIKNLNSSIKKKSIAFKQKIKHVKKGTHLKEQFNAFLDESIEHTKHKNDFKQLSNSIQKSRLFIENISYHSNLALDSKLTSYILIQTIVLTLPELIEYNGQIRGISSSIINNKLTNKQKEDIVVLESKIKEKVAQLKFHIKELTNSKDIQIIKTIYTNTINAQNALLNFVNNNILLEKQIMLDPNQIFRLVSNNIEFITLLYKANFKELNQMLYTRIKNKETIAYIIVISAFASVIFILYINLLFYRKNKKYIEQIKLLSITDGMTKLFNRRHFDNEFIKQLKIQKRISQNLTFIIMDIDHFKQYNDLYGHKEGDMALINVAQCLELNLQRPSDIAFRLGGEEFGILCTDMNKSNSLLFANKIRTSIENLKIEHKGSSTNKFITISIGLIIIEPNTIYEIDNIYKCADEALYTAKRNGRNQVIVYDIENRNNSVVECDLPIN